MRFCASLPYDMRKEAFGRRAVGTLAIRRVGIALPAVLLVVGEQNRLFMATSSIHVHGPSIIPVNDRTPRFSLVCHKAP